MLILCESKNYVLKCLRGEYERHDFIKLSNDTINELEKIRYMPKGKYRENSVNSFQIAIDETNAMLIRDYIKDASDRLNIQTISMIIQKVGIIYMMPDRSVPAKIDSCCY